MTAQDQQSREAYEDGKWYWVEREGWYGELPKIAPARYRADCDAWYSFDFSGITTRYIKVLEPCERQAARALPASMEPVGYLIDWPDEPDLGHYFAEGASTTGRSQPLHTAAQVQAMGRVPPGWQITEDMHIAAVKVLHRASGVDGLPQRMVDAMLAAAPRPPAAQEGVQAVNQQLTTEATPFGYIVGNLPSGNFEVQKTVPTLAQQVCGNCAPVYNMPHRPTAQERKPLTPEQIHKWWASENGLEDCDMGKLIDFTAVVREVEAKLGIKEPPHGQQT